MTALSPTTAAGLRPTGIRCGVELPGSAAGAGTRSHTWPGSRASGARPLVEADRAASGHYLETSCLSHGENYTVADGR